MQVVYESCRFGAIGGTDPTAADITLCPQNDIGSPELHDFQTLENVTFDRPDNSGGDIILGGSHLTVRNARRNNGAGVYVNVQTGFRPGRIPAGRDGPYFVETVNTRPIPSAF